MASDMPPGQPVPPNHWRAHVPTAHICADADDGFKHLQAHVATTAFDSDDYADAPKCHPNTRIAVLDDIMHWIAIQAATRTQWVLWLNGAAGAGKSAIGRSIVALCLAQDVPVARFFFFRTDAARNGPKPVVATLAYQLMESIPELRSIVIPRIQADALVFTKSLETQFRALVFGPLLQLQSGSSLQQKTVVLLLDGVDECVGYDKQAQIIRIIADFVKTQAFPLVAFFGSRAETQLCAEFRAPARAGVLLQLALDTDYRADGDIRHFLTDSFATIRSTHPFRRALRDSNWPDHAAVDDLVHRASGQFIYASVALNFISAANQDPARLLAVVRGLRPSGKLTPFAQLDALYRHIFSQVADIHAASLVLAWDMFTVKDDGALSVGTDPVFGTMDNTDIKVALADLTSVLTYTTDRRIKFLHASLPDFLLDPKRSQIYHIDRATWSAQLSIVTLRRIIHMEPSRQAAGAVQWQNNHKVAELSTLDFVTMMESYLPHAKPTAELRELVAALQPDIHLQNFGPGTPRINRRIPGDEYARQLVSYLAIIRKWDFGDGVDGQVYREQRQAIERYAHARFSPDLIKQFHEYIYGALDKEKPFWARLKLRLLHFINYG